MTAEHGTNAAAQKHYREGEELCDPCREARRAVNRARPKPTAAQKAAKAQHERDYYAALIQLRKNHPGEYLSLLYKIRSDRASERE